MSAADDARKFARLADRARAAPAPKPPRTGLENREAAPPDSETPEQFYARVAALRLLSEPCDG